MDTTIDALKNLYVALGGTASDVADITIIPDMINAISALVASGATAELPKVTTNDNGKLLTVVSGKWAKATAPVEGADCCCRGMGQGGFAGLITGGKKHERKHISC